MALQLQVQLHAPLNNNYQTHSLCAPFVLGRYLRNLSDSFHSHSGQLCIRTIAVGVNSSEKDFLKAFKRPTSVLAGYTGQFLVKPLLGYVFGFIAVAIFGFPTPVGFFSKYVMLFGHFCLRYLCVGAPLAINIKPAMFPFGLTVLLLFIACYLTAFIAGYFLTGVVFHTTPDVKAIQRTLSYETGMQRSLLALANRFFQDLQSL